MLGFRNFQEIPEVPVPSFISRLPQPRNVVLFAPVLHINADHVLLKLWKILLWVAFLLTVFDSELWSTAPLKQSARSTRFRVFSRVCFSGMGVRNECSNPWFPVAGQRLQREEVGVQEIMTDASVSDEALVFSHAKLRRYGRCSVTLRRTLGAGRD